MPTTDPAHGHCDPGFNVVGAAFERNMEDGDIGAAFALYQGGTIKVDLWGAAPPTRVAVRFDGCLGQRIRCVLCVLSRDE